MSSRPTKKSTTKSSKAKKASMSASSSAKGGSTGSSGLSTGGKVIIAIFAVLMALSMMLPSLSAIVQNGNSQDSQQEQADDSDSTSDANADSTADSTSDSSSTTDYVAQIDDDYSQLTADLESKLAGDPQNLAYLLNLGKDYMSWGVQVSYFGSTDANTSHANELLEKAIGYFDQYLELNDASAVRVDRALCQFYEGETGDAQTALEQLTQDDPDYGPAWANLGMVYQARGDSDSARSAYEQAIAADPDDEYGAKSYGEQGIKSLDAAASSSSTATGTTTGTTGTSTGAQGLSDTLNGLGGTNF